jgi:hypothetical protein
MDFPTNVSLSLSSEQHDDIHKIATILGISVDEYISKSIRRQRVDWREEYRLVVLRWMSMNGVPQFGFDELSISDDLGIIWKDSGIDMSGRKLVKIPYKFSSVLGKFDVSNNNLSSFENFPDVAKEINIMGNPNMVIPENLHQLVLLTSEDYKYGDAVGKCFYYKQIKIILDLDLFSRTERLIKLNQVSH